VLPVADEAGKLTLLAKDPFNSSVINELSFILQRETELRRRLPGAGPSLAWSAVTR
jgi:hypothetical protein